MKVQFFIFLAVLLVLSSCKQPPKKKLSQYKLQSSYKMEGDSLVLSIHNTLACPLRMKASSKADTIDQALQVGFPFVLPPFTDTTFRYFIGSFEEELKIGLSATFGDTAQKLIDRPIAFPFPKGRRVKIVQGYNGSYSHQSDYSRYAIDFDLDVGDTITAADDAWVIGVIEDYTDGGSSRKWRDFANAITLYHPNSQLYTQYVHLDYKGSLVEVGDFVKKGQAIGISGLTGFTSGPHLHFNTLAPTDKGMSSVKVRFEKGIKGEELRKGMNVSH